MKPFYSYFFSSKTVFLLCFSGVLLIGRLLFIFLQFDLEASTILTEVAVLS